MMRRKSLVMLFVIILLIISGAMSVLAQDEEGTVLRQWASFAQASSEYTGDAWSAEQATGAPDTINCEDAETAWASETGQGEEALILFYDTPVIPAQINIYQNLGRGAIIGVEVIPDGSEGETIAIEDSADPGTDCPGIFTLNLPDDLGLIMGVIILLDESLVEGWNEIDAVELVGLDIGATSSTSSGSVPDGPTGISVTCDNGTSFDNGIVVRANQLRTGFTYTATAIGIDGFDPVLAVLDSVTGRGLCEDDTREAMTYSAALPTSGFVEESSTSSQIYFSNNGGEPFADIDIVVGGFGNQSGEFILIFEGMVLSQADGYGDSFSVQVTPGMIASDTPLSAYQIAVTNGFDPLMYLYTIDNEVRYLADTDGNAIACDDGGYSDRCWNTQEGLSRYYVSRSRNRSVPGGQFDAMISFDVPEEANGNFYNYMMSSPDMQYFGDYIVVFHMGIGN